MKSHLPILPILLILNVACTTAPTPTPEPTLVIPSVTQAVATLVPSPTSTSYPTITPLPYPTPTPLECTPGGQENFIFLPGRLSVMGLCVHVIGIVRTTPQDAENDGDLTFDVAVDPPYMKYLSDGNRRFRNGYLHVEIICHNLSIVTRNTLAIRACANFPGSFRITPPTVGQRIWMEGQWVLDDGNNHWAELHPLFRWGPSP